jgi:hypothetical protein
MSVGMASAAFAQGFVQGVGNQLQQRVGAGSAPLTAQGTGHHGIDHQGADHQVHQQVPAGSTPLEGSRASAPSTQAGAGFAQEAGPPQVFGAALVPLNGSGASGTATLVRNGTQLNTTINSSGMAPNLPHAQHIHGMAQAISECPSLAADANADGLINTTEGAPFYGPIAVSFTTFGDTSPASGLAVDRFPVASSVGTVNYFRSLIAPPGVAFNLGNFAIVQHGVDLNGNGEYDFDAAGASDLDPSLPQEATIPANCGVINPA